MKNSVEYIDDIKNVIKNIPDAEALKGCDILVTGATGLIGSAVADILLVLNKECGYGMKIYLAGRKVEGVAERFSDYEEGRDYFFVKYDATKQVTDLIAVDYIVHGASNADPAKISSEPVETMLANIMGLNGLLSAADKDKLKRVLYISSSEVYGVGGISENKAGGEKTGANGGVNDRAADGESYGTADGADKASERPEYYSRLFKENDLGYVDILSPRSSYPSSKRAAETLCIAYAEEYKVDAVIVRPGHIYGPLFKATDNRVQVQFSTKAAKGENIVMKSKGEQLRSYTHVLDCASAILTVLIKGKSRNAYNISARQAIVTIREMAEAFAAAGGVEIVFDIPTETEVKSVSVMPCAALNSEKLEALGWKAAFDMKAGAEQTVRELKNMLK